MLVLTVWVFDSAKAIFSSKNMIVLVSINKERARTLYGQKCSALQRQNKVYIKDERFRIVNIILFYFGPFMTLFLGTLVLPFYFTQE